jgi:hypothetical protein
MTYSPMEFMEITPKVAKQLLRTIPKAIFNERRVQCYTEEMLRGRFRANSVIKLSKRGDLLLDGRHRCCAVIKSGQTIRVRVERAIH